jgi:hypothetical protein
VLMDIVTSTGLCIAWSELEQLPVVTAAILIIRVKEVFGKVAMKTIEKPTPKNMGEAVGISKLGGMEQEIIICLDVCLIYIRSRFCRGLYIFFYSYFLRF